MSELKFECSHCKQHLACDDQFAGREISCPACHKLTIVPGAPAKPAGLNQKSGMTFVPDSWKKAEAHVDPPAAPQKSGMTHVPDSWVKPAEEPKPQGPK